MSININGPGLFITPNTFNRIPEIKRTQQILVFLIYVVLVVYISSFLGIIYSLSMNYRTNTYEPILILFWILFFAIGMLVTKSYYPMGLLLFASLGVLNIIGTCILIVCVTVGMVIVTTQPSKQVTEIPFTVIPIVSCLTSVIIDAVIVIVSFKLSLLITKHTKSNGPERV